MDLYTRLLKELALVTPVFPKLNKISKGKFGVIITGEIDLIDPYDGKTWENYKLKIFVSTSYPNIIPTLRETEGKIKDHISKDGLCCLCPRVEEILILGKNYTILDYINKLVIPYLAAQKLNDLGQDWPFGEYSHYSLGIIEYYKEKLKTTDIKLVLKCLKFLSGEISIRRNDKCFCGNSNKFKNCHSKILNQFNIVDRKVFQHDLYDIENEKRTDLG